MGKNDNIVLAIVGVLLPPVAVLIEKGVCTEFWIDLILTLLLIWVGGILYAFHIFSVEIV